MFRRRSDGVTRKTRINAQGTRNKGNQACSVLGPRTLTGRGKHAVSFLDVGPHFLRRNDFIAVGVDVVETRSQAHITPDIVLGQETFTGTIHLAE
jgi:hypothetical protein